MKANFKKYFFIILGVGVLFTILGSIYIPGFFDERVYKFGFGSLAIIVVKILKYAVYACFILLCIGLLYFLANLFLNFGLVIEMAIKFVSLNHIKSPFFIIAHPFTCLVGIAALDVVGVAPYEIGFALLLCLSYIFSFVAILIFWFLQFSILKFFNSLLTVEKFITIKTSIGGIFIIMGSIASYSWLALSNMHPGDSAGAGFVIIYLIIPIIFYASRYFFGFFDDFSKLKKTSDNSQHLLE